MNSKETLYFATTNQGKLNEANAILGLPLQGLALDIPEIQSLNLESIAIDKAKQYFAKLKKPLFVEDVSLTFTALKHLPGPYISDFEKSLGLTGLIDLLHHHSDRSATAQTTLCYIAPNTAPQIFTGILKGSIAKKPLGKGFGWDPIFIPQGHTKTFAQMSPEEKNAISMRALALKKLKKFLTKNS